MVTRYYEKLLTLCGYVLGLPLHGNTVCISALNILIGILNQQSYWYRKLNVLTSSFNSTSLSNVIISH